MKTVINGVTMRVERKPIKYLYIRVSPPDGSIHVSVPYRTPQPAVEEFVNSKLLWIEKQQRRFALLHKHSLPRFMGGEMHPLWGRDYLLEVERGAVNGVSLQAGKIILTHKKEEESLEGLEGILKRWYRKILSEAIPEALSRCERIVGERAKEWRIKDMRTRWGTCNIKARRIWISLRLVQNERECLDYVLTHELVHLLERGHTAKFYEHMDQYFPDWRRVKKSMQQWRTGDMEESV